MIIKLIKKIINKLFSYSHNVIIKREPYISYNDNSVISDVNPYMPTSVNFIPSHPLAGTEYSGPKSGFSTLFENRYWLIVCEKETDQTKKLTSFFENFSDLSFMQIHVCKPSFGCFVIVNAVYLPVFFYG